MGDIYEKTILQIISEQKIIVGPLAIELARQVDGIDVQGSTITITKDGRSTLRNLIGVYSQLFGRTSVEVCKDVIAHENPHLKPQELEQLLQLN